MQPPGTVPAAAGRPLFDDTCGNLLNPTRTDRGMTAMPQLANGRQPNLPTTGGRGADLPSAVDYAVLGRLPA
jgi:hypothetical protein